ncbi:MAG TPA: hypothetical protein VHD56_13380 [Tepidisphaeraceae bacterium]|nr:hypothetical protein [Tepidisphaeraceae bacterium]
MLLRIFLALLLLGGSAMAQPALPSDQRMDQIEKRLEDLERKYNQDIKSRDEEIARLKAQVQQQSTTTPAATTSTDSIEQSRQAILKDIESREPSAQILRVPANFNPDLAVIGDFKGNLSSLNDNPARNRFDLATLELEMRAAVDPRADAVAVIPFSREVDDPLFFNKADASGNVDTGVEIEEAYLFMHDFGVPNLTAKLGRFHLRFGRQNILHNHDWPTVDNNFVNQSFLGPEALTDNGLSLSYVIPPQYVGGQYIEAIAEIISGEGNGDEGPVVNNSAVVDGPALNTHLLWNHDIARDWNLELGGSWLTAKHDDDNQQNVNLFGTDLTLIHTDPTGGFFNQLIQAETIYGDVDSSRTDSQHAWGAYLLAQQQINRDWYAGVRLDYTENALNDQQDVWGASAYLTWYWSEFLRFRMEYQHKDGDVPAEDTLYFQATWVFGAHPPHPYWSMR